MQRVSGYVNLTVRDQTFYVKGSVKYGIGTTKKTAEFAANGAVLGFKEILETPPFLECTVYDRGNLSVEALHKIQEETVTLELANGKVISYQKAWYAGTGEGDTGEGTINFRIESETATEIRSGN